MHKLSRGKETEGGKKSVECTKVKINRIISIMRLFSEQRLMTMVMRMERAKVSHSSLTHTTISLTSLSHAYRFFLNKIFFNNKIKMQKSNECKPLIFIGADPSSIPTEIKNILCIRIRREHSSREWSVWKHDENKCKSIFIGRMPMCLFPTLVYLN